MQSDGMNGTGGRGPERGRALRCSLLPPEQNHEQGRQKAGQLHRTMHENAIDISKNKAYIADKRGVVLKTKCRVFPGAVIPSLFVLSCLNSSDDSVPNAPTNLTAINADSSSVRLSWADASDNEEGFAITRWSYLSSSDTIIDLPAPDTTTYTDGGLITYRYRYTVRAYNSNGESGPSNSVDIWVGPPLAPPTNLTATGIDVHTIRLSWTSNASNVLQTTVERSSSSNTTGFTLLGTSPTSTYTDTGCAAMTTYWYRVFQTDSLNVVSPYSTVATAMTTNTVLPPSNVTASWTGSAFIISWTASTTPGVAYTIHRRKNGAMVFSTCASGITATSYSDATADTGIIYYYAVQAVTNNGNYLSPFSAESRGFSVFIHPEQENNGPPVWDTGFWYVYGELLRGYDCFEVSGTYSDSNAIYDSSLSMNYDYDIFRISLSPGQSIRFQPVAGNVDIVNGMKVTLCRVLYYTSSGVYLEEDVHDFAPGGETYTPPNPNWNFTFSESYVRVSIPTGISGSDYDFIFEIIR